MMLNKGDDDIMTSIEISGHRGQRAEGKAEAARQFHHLRETQPWDQTVQQSKRGKPYLYLYNIK